jgi:hypothetical protein
LCGATLAAPAAADASSFEARGVSTFEASEYASELGVSVQRAEANLEIQQRGALIVAQLEAALGKDYAGVWFDNESGEFVVPLLPGADRAAVKAQLEGAGLKDSYRTTAAADSWHELEANQEDVDRQLTGLIEQGLVETFLDPRTNSIAIRQAAPTNEIQRDRIRNVAMDEEANVAVRPQRADGFGIAPTACNGKFAVCGNPFRGGMGLWATYTESWELEAYYPYTQAVCTAGFKAIGNVSGNRFVLTAGHCVTFGNGTYYWKSFDDQLNGHLVGSIEQYVLPPTSDYAKINANGSDWDTPSWPTVVAKWGSDLERPINNEAHSYLGEYAIQDLTAARVVDTLPRLTRLPINPMSTTKKS